MFDVSVYAALALVTTRIPLISTIHGFADIKGPHLTVWIKCAILRLLGHDIVFVSRALEDQILKSFSILRPKVKTIANGIPTAAFRAHYRTCPNSVGGTIVFGALGNIRKPKGYGILLEAVAEVRKRVPGVKILVAGQPDSAGLYQQLLAQRSKLGLEDCVEFLGHVTDVSGFFEQIDCLVSSSLTEGMPLSLMEAMAAGLPVVATRCGGVPELIDHEVHGLLCEPGRTDELASAMIRMAENPSLREKSGKASSERAAKSFSLDAMADRYEELYTSATAAGQ
jgi:glycosyltransferase involved in cell wall biosynthesis